MSNNGALSTAEFAARLREELDRAGLSVRALAERIAALPDRARPSGMSYQSLSEFTSRGTRVRLPSDQQLRAVLLVCRTEQTRADHLRADRSLLAQYGTGAVAGKERPARDAPVALAEHEIVVHLFAAADGPSADACWAYLRATVRRCAEELGLTSPIRTYPVDLPEDCPSVETGDAFLAARGRPGPGVVEVAARRVHDVVCLSLVVAPQDGSSWSDLLASWRAVRGEPPAGLLGSVVIAQAVLAHPEAELDVARLTPEVRSELPLDGLLLQRGALRADEAATPCVVWEVIEDSDDGPAVQRRSHRDLVVVAPAQRMPELSAWTWSRGGGSRALPPFARYLLHAAKLRYSARVWADSDFTRVRAEVDSLVDRRSGRRTALEVGAASLTRSAEKVERLQITVDTAVGNLAGNAAGGQGEGLFADDRALGEWLTTTLSTEFRYLQNTLAAGRRVLATPPEPTEEGAASMSLEPGQRKALAAALESAYPTYRDLALMFDEELGRNLARDAREDRMRLVLNEVIGRAVAEGRLTELIAAAIAGNPGNEQLRALHTSGLSPQSGLVGSPEREFVERVVDTEVGFRSATVFLTRLLQLAARVCLVEVVTGGRLVSGGTGFLVRPDLVLTNHHVLERVIDGRSSPADATFTFDFHELPDGSLSRGSVHRIATDGLVSHSPDTPTGLDYALARLDASPGTDRMPDGSERSAIAVPRTAPNPVIGTPLLILQHPDGEPLRLAWENKGVTGVDTDGMRITHAVNTEHGSSGSPCFTYDLELVALHRGWADVGGRKLNRAVPIGKIAEAEPRIVGP